MTDVVFALNGVQYIVRGDLMGKIKFCVQNVGQISCNNRLVNLKKVKKCNSRILPNGCQKIRKVIDYYYK